MGKALDFLTGDGKQFEKAFFKLYGKRDCSEEIKDLKHAAQKKYLYLLIAAAMIFTALAIYENRMENTTLTVGDGNEASVKRPSGDGGPLKMPMKLNAAWGEGERLTKNVIVIVRPEEAAEAEEATGDEAEGAQPAVESEINKAIRIINKSDAGEELLLPSELPGGIRLTWEEAQSRRFVLVFPLSALAAFILYQGRYSRIKKMSGEAKDSIVKELPEFINKLVLLLNAGLVITSAFNRILSNYGGGKEVKSYFYQQLLEIDRGNREMNSSIIGGFKEFAGRSGVREFSRVAGIIADNMDKGAELVEKLQNESELLWLTKKKSAEEKGRLAETKLTFPLVLLLLVLIMVTVAPALMGI